MVQASQIARLAVTTRADGALCSRARIGREARAIRLSSRKIVPILLAVSPLRSGNDQTVGRMAAEYREKVVEGTAGAAAG